MFHTSEGLRSKEALVKQGWGSRDLHAGRRNRSEGMALPRAAHCLRSSYMVTWKRTKNPKRMQMGICEKRAVGHNWEAGLQHKAQAHVATGM